MTTNDNTVTATSDITRDVLERAVDETLRELGYADSPIADLAHEVLRLEMNGIDDRAETTAKVVRNIEQRAKQNVEWFNSQKDA